MRRISLKEKSSIAALSSLISKQIAGKPLAKAGRSHASMLLLEFGRLKRESRQGRRRRFIHRGEWTLLVELSEWTMQVPPAPVVTDNSEYRLIDKMLPSLVGRTVENLVFGAEGRLVIEFKNGAAFVASGKPIIKLPRLDIWQLSNVDYWCMKLRPSGKFVVYPDSRATAPPAVKR